MVIWVVFNSLAATMTSFLKERIRRNSKSFCTQGEPFDEVEMMAMGNCSFPYYYILSYQLG